MKCSQVVELIAEQMEKHGDKEAYIDSDGVISKVTEVVFFEASDIDETDPILVIR